MKRLITLLLLVFAVSCGFLTSEDEARSACHRAGLTNVHVINSHKIAPGMFGCSEKDAAAYILRAINPAGQEVQVTACVGFPCKGTTIRY